MQTPPHLTPTYNEALSVFELVVDRIETLDAKASELFPSPPSERPYEGPFATLKEREKNPSPFVNNKQLTLF